MTLLRSLPLLAVLLAAATAAAANGHDCVERASSACLRAFDLPRQAGRLHYYQSLQPGSTAGPGPRSALVVMHGYPRDADRSFVAGLRAAHRAGRLRDTLVVAPLYQVSAQHAGRCRTPQVPVAQAGDALWSCGGWLAGAPSSGNHPIGSFAALDALLAELARQWPGLRSVTLVGFSAGAQMLQHSIGFAAQPPPGLSIRYVIADPGSWLYFDPVRPLPRRDGQPTSWSRCGDADAGAGCDFAFEPPSAPSCPGYHRWKYGTDALPANLGRSAAQARSRYAGAVVDYLQGEWDSGAAKGAFYPILDKSCAAMLQGPFRLQRGVAYAAYERALLKPTRPRRLVVVPGCGHDVSCVLPSAAARPLLFSSLP